MIDRGAASPLLASIAIAGHRVAPTNGAYIYYGRGDYLGLQKDTTFGGSGISQTGAAAPRRAL
jgi:hypothetical protein